MQITILARQYPIERKGTGPSLLVSLDARRADDGGHLRNAGLQHASEVFRAAGGLLEPHVAQTLLHVRRLQRATHRTVDPHDGLPRRPGRRDDAVHTGSIDGWISRLGER